MHLKFKSNFFLAFIRQLAQCTSSIYQQILLVAPPIVPVIDYLISGTYCAYRLHSAVYFNAIDPTVLPPINLAKEEACFETVLFIFNFSNFQKLFSVFKQFTIKNERQVLAFYPGNVRMLPNCYFILKHSRLSKPVSLRKGIVSTGYLLRMLDRFESKPKFNVWQIGKGIRLLVK